MLQWLGWHKEYLAVSLGKGKRKHTGKCTGSCINLLATAGRFFYNPTCSAAGERRRQWGLLSSSRRSQQENWIIFHYFTPLNGMGPGREKQPKKRKKGQSIKKYERSGNFHSIQIFFKYLSVFLLSSFFFFFFGLNFSWSFSSSLQQLMSPIRKRQQARINFWGKLLSCQCTWQCRTQEELSQKRGIYERSGF